ncbi:metallophosphoesterase [Fodinicurvata sp. EGI_FJ10296]|uniref:metallophosphoesterase n=1 Tax=Fodinicurvata sp. EGI_FJ10296 TaxID=3231908 RepID=UPI003452CB09
MRVVQITDPHVTATGTLRADAIDTGQRFKAALDHCRTLDPAPDLVLLTGDLANDARADEYAAVAAIIDALPADMPPMALLPGNHDDRAALCRLAENWRFAPDYNATDFVQTAIDPGGGLPVVLMLDSLVDGATEGRLCARRLVWVGERLTHAANRPVIIAMHHPPFVPTIMPGQPACEGTDALAALLARHGGLIGSLSGHLHRPMAATFCGASSWVGPSTAYRLPLAQTTDDLQRAAGERVCYAVHDWSPQTGLRSAEIVV